MQYSKDNTLYLLTILECIAKIELYVDGYEDAESFYNSDDQLVFNAVCHLLLAIGEESNKLSPALKEEISIIAWEQISGLRNRIAHDYRGIDAEIVFQIIRFELELLQKACIAILNLTKVPKEELAQLVNSHWYKHLEYLKIKK